MSRYGYNGKILHIDLAEKKTEIEEKDEIWYRTYGGGGLLGTYFLIQETSANIDAYDPENLLIFTSSVVAGIKAPGLARFSVVTKSPLSQGVGETRCEGPFGHYLKGSGYDAIIFHGRAEKPVYVVVEEGEITIKSASDLWGKDTYQTTRKLEQAYGKDDIEVAAIGPAGENLVRYASIVTHYSIQAMRMGVGAVMGSKNVKALVLKGKNMPAVYDKQGLDEIKEYFQENMLANTLSMWQKEAPGFSASADLSDYETAYIGAKNYTEDFLVEDSEFIRSNYMKYYQGEILCPGCPNDCIKKIDPGCGKPEATGIHQQISGSMGPMIGNKSLKLMLEANALCNLYGLDPVSLGFTISFAMECYEKGIITKKDTDGMELKFGNQEDILELIEAISQKKGFGKILAEGSKRAAEIIGNNAEKFALHVKGIEMVPFEPRTQTNLALGYAAAPIGPRYDICEHDWDFDLVSGWEHTLDDSRALGIYKRIPMEYIGKDKVRYYKILSDLWSACDALDICIFASAPTRVLSLEKITELIEVITGWDSSSYEFMQWGERRNQLMRIYNLREGLSAQDDKLPQRFYKQPIKEGRLKGTVIDENKFNEAIKTYYQMMGWDEQGVPRDAARYQHLLGWTV